MSPIPTPDFTFCNSKAGDRRNVGWVEQSETHRAASSPAVGYAALAANPPCMCRIDSGRAPFHTRAKQGRASGRITSIRTNLDFVGSWGGSNGGDCNGSANGRRRPDHRRLRRQRTGRGENIAAASARHRAHRRGLFLRRHRLHRVRLAGPLHPAVQVCDRSRSCGHRQRHRVRPVRRHRRPGRVLGPVRAALHLPVQSAVVRHLHPARRVRPERHDADHLPLHRRRRAGRRATALLRLCRRIFAQAHPRPHPGDHSFHRRRLRVADRHRACAPSRQFHFGTRKRLARRLGDRRHRRADRLGAALFAAGIAALSGDARPRQGSNRRARPARHCRADAAAVDRCREQHQERPVRGGLQPVPDPRHRRHDLLHGILRRRHRARRLAAEHHGRRRASRSPSRCNTRWP